jgi:ABC-2 type transport system ATP-binding protein
VGIIEQGKLLFSGQVDEILARAKVGQIVHLEVTNRAEDAATLLRTVEGISCVDVVAENGCTRIDVTVDSTTPFDVSELPNRLIAQGFRITSMQGEQVNLETAFMRLTKGLVG